MVKKSLNVLELSSLIWDNRRFLIIFSLAISSLFAFYSLSLDNVYSSQSVLYSKNDSKDGNMNNSSFGGLASIAGIELPSSNNAALISLAIESIKSKDFFEFLINSDEEFLPLLIASKKYDSKSGITEIDETIYKDNKFLSKDDNFFINSYRIYLSSFSIELDNKTNHIRFSTYHASPYIAEYLLKLYKENINLYIRDIKLEDAKKAISFYKNELANIKNPILMENISMRILSELQTEFAAGTSNDFVFSYIDSPRVNHKKVGPPRAIITFFGLIIGFAISLVLILFKRAKKIYKLAN